MEYGVTHYSTTPLFHYPIPPLLHHSMVLCFHYSNIPLFHYTNFFPSFFSKVGTTNSMSNSLRVFLAGIPSSFNPKARYAFFLASKNFPRFNVLGSPYLSNRVSLKKRSGR